MPNTNQYQVPSYNATPYNSYKYKTTKLIGSGTFGEIWNVIEKSDVNNKYAIKMIKNGRKKYEQNFVNEGKRVLHLNKIQTSEVGKHFIIKCKELLYCTSENNPILHSLPLPLMGPCLVMELCGYSLSQYMKFHECRNSKISLATIRCISVQILFAMSFLHGIGECIHSDLKPENILIDYSDCCNAALSKSPRIKIIDFGNAIDQSVDINRPRKLKSFQLQSLWYRSPEVLLGNYEEISPLIDMWSIGCILFELTSLNKLNKRKLLFAANKLNPHHVVSKIGAKLSAFPAYVYNAHKSVHYDEYINDIEISNESTYLKLKNQRINKIKSHFNGELELEEDVEFMCLIDLLSALLDLNPLTRYTSEDAIRHKFIVYNYRNECIQNKIHPIIKSCDDKQRQKKISLQIKLNESRIKSGSSSSSKTSKLSESPFPIIIVKQHLKLYQCTMLNNI